ncbi:MAG: homoserine O-succinyltransferase, partial [Clostridia bacterium]|nr:homoserine O-succinyltransferase [Clostridia bacterium]
MPIVIDKDIPAYKILTGEKIFVMDTARAGVQDIRPIEIAILNLMPTKETTETQFMRLLSNSPLQVNVTLVRTKTYNPTHVEEQYLSRFYKNFDEIKGAKFDGMIITGAPVENMEFEDVAYWKELEEILDWTKT